MKKNLIFIGMPAVGKSTVGIVVAKRLGMQFIDTDLLIQEQEKKLLCEIIAEVGEDGFIEIENRVNADVDAENAVISPGGSVIYCEEAMKHYKNIGTVVYLKASYQTIKKRIRNPKKRGVVLRDGQTFRQLYEERVKFFEKYADITICEDGCEIEDTIENVLEEVKKLGPDSITVHSLAIKRASRLHLLWEEYKDQTGRDIDAMAEVTANTAREMGLEPYYLYRQKNMAGNFENVGYAAPGKACIYNILIMEELQTIAACGAGTTTKLIFPAENRKERVENVKDADQYVERIDEMLERKEKIVTIQPCEDSDRKKG